MQPKIAVIGTVFVDYKGFAPKSYLPQGRNIGEIEIVPGGVARNVAVNMKQLGCDVWFSGCINDDNAGELLKAKLDDHKINLEHLAIVDGGGTGAWLAILAHDGALIGSVSQMPDTSAMHKAIVPILPELFKKIDFVALEVDLSDEIVKEIVAQSKKDNVKIYALPGNLSVIKNNYGFFADMECFICNDTEANILFNTDLNSPGKILQEATVFAREQKLKNFVVTLGEQGALFVDHNGQSGHQKAYKTKVVDSTGAGDSFFSATVSALLYGKSLKQAVDIGAKVASVVIAHKESDCSELKQTIQKELNLDWFDLKY